MAKPVLSAADSASLYCALLLMALVLVCSSRQQQQQQQQQEEEEEHVDGAAAASGGERVGGIRFLAERRCDEIYVVGEGETLNTISDKCGDPYIVERNPHIQDPDDVFPGLVIRIIPSVPVGNKNHQRY